MGGCNQSQVCQLQCAFSQNDMSSWCLMLRTRHMRNLFPSWGFSLCFMTLVKFLMFFFQHCRLRHERSTSMCVFHSECAKYWDLSSVVLMLSISIDSAGIGGGALHQVDVRRHRRAGISPLIFLHPLIFLLSGFFFPEELCLKFTWFV